MIVYVLEIIAELFSLKKEKKKTGMGRTLPKMFCIWEMKERRREGPYMGITSIFPFNCLRFLKSAKIYVFGVFVRCPCLWSQYCSLCMKSLLISSDICLFVFIFSSFFVYYIEIYYRWEALVMLSLVYPVLCKS